MRVFAKKTFEFTNEEGGVARTIPLGFSELPDWVKKHPLFKLAAKAGELEVVAKGLEEETIKELEEEIKVEAV